jgi:hypothetical protein
MQQIFRFAVQELTVRRAGVRNGGGRGTHSGFSAHLCDGDCLLRLSFWVRGCTNGRPEGAQLLPKAAPDPVRGATNATLSLYPVGSAGRRVTAIRKVGTYFSYLRLNNRLDYFGTALTSMGCGLCDARNTTEK